MILKDSQGRECEVGLEYNRDGSNYVSAGVYLQSGASVPEDELDWMTDNHAEVLADAAFMRLVERAESISDEASGG